MTFSQMWNYFVEIAWMWVGLIHGFFVVVPSFIAGMIIFGFDGYDAIMFTFWVTFCSIIVSTPALIYTNPYKSKRDHFVDDFIGNYIIFGYGVGAIVVIVLTLWVGIQRLLLALARHPQLELHPVFSAIGVAIMVVAMALLISYLNIAWNRAISRNSRSENPLA